jgi:glycosyltransferase involved in cell wall biosynthesis
MESRKVSAIITYYNEGELLHRAIESIDQQTYPGEIEVVVVDDASDIAPTLPSRSRHPVRIVRSGRNIRLAAARNLGLAETTGEYVCYLDADDVFLPEKVEKQVGYLADHPDVLVVGSPYYVHRDGKVWLQVPDVILQCFPELASQRCVLPSRVRHEACLHYLFQMGAPMFRRRALEGIGGFDEFYGPWGEDWDLWVRLAQVGPIGFIPDPASRYLCRSSGSITTTLNPEKFACGASVFRKWRRIVEGLPRDYHRTLLDQERRWHLLAAQAYLETQGRGWKALGHSLRSLLCGPSFWGIRSSVRSGLHALFPRRGRRLRKTA